MSYQEDVQRYHELLAEGVPPRDAFFSVWPDGLQGAADKRAKEESKKQQGDQLAGVAGTVAGAVATQQAIKHAPSLWETKAPDTTTTTTTKPTTQTQAPGAPEMVSANYVGEPQVIPQNAAVPEGMVEVGVANNPDGSQGKLVAPEGNIGEDGSVNLGAWAQGAGGAFQLYNAYQKYEDGDNVGAGLSAAAGAANVAAAAGNATAGSVAPYAGLAMGAYNTHNAAQDGSRTRDQKGAEVMKQVGLTAADYFTFGLSSVADGLIRGTGTGAKWGNKLDKLASKTMGAKAIGSVLGGLDTKHTQLKNTQKLFNDAEKSGDQNYLSYLQGARKDTIEEPETNKKGYYFGDYKTWDEAKAAGLNAATLTHVLGNLETFGPEWASLTEDQRVLVTQAMINEDMYHSDKGEVNIKKDKRDRALTIFNTIKDVGFDPAFVEMPEQTPAEPLGSDLAQTPVNPNGDPSMQNNKMSPNYMGQMTPEQQAAFQAQNGWTTDNKMLIQQPSAPYPGATNTDPSISPENLNQGWGMPQGSPQSLQYVGSDAASKYPSIREYIAGMQQGGQSVMPQISGGSWGQDAAQNIGAPQMPGASQPSMIAPKPGAAPQDYAGAQPAQAQHPNIRNLQISAALKRAREMRD